MIRHQDFDNVSKLVTLVVEVYVQAGATPLAAAASVTHTLVTEGFVVKGVSPINPNFPYPSDDEGDMEDFA